MVKLILRSLCQQSKSFFHSQNPHASVSVWSRRRLSFTDTVFDKKFTDGPILQEHAGELSVEKLFKVLHDPKTQRVPVSHLYREIEMTGIELKDPRLASTMQFINQLQRQAVSADRKYLHEHAFNANYLDLETFRKCISTNLPLFYRIVEHNFIIPKWTTFQEKVTRIYDNCLHAKDSNGSEGDVSQYLPQLARAKPDSWCVSICTVDGQRLSLGPKTRFTLQAAQYPLAYSLALHETSDELVHSYVGHEPSGQPYMSLELNESNKPHNPMINAGAIVIASLLKSRASLADSFDHVLQHYQRMSGGEYVGFNNAVFLTERELSNRNYAIGYILKENNCFPSNVNLSEIMDFYFQLCSIDVDASAGSVMAATLANAGICPITGHHILAPKAVRDTLSLMHSCGMYDFSGEFAFRVGLPAKSAISGAILVVVPNVMGICLYSPRLNNMNNSVRGIRFCEELVDTFNFHNYDTLHHLQKKHDPRRRPFEAVSRSIVSCLFSAFNNDITALRRVFNRGVNMDCTDYDGRTTLHIAAAEGHTDVVRFLLYEAGVNPEPKDRWGFTPLHDAKIFHHAAVVDTIEEFLKEQRST